MPYFKNDIINILFIHIPKTGGTSLENYFSSKFNIPLNNKSLYLFMDEKEKKEKNIMINSSLQHITYSQMIKYNDIFHIDFKNLKIITIVRNPYERLISDFFFLKLMNVNTTKEEVFNILQKYLASNDYDNHNIPQYNFIVDIKSSNNISILKTENLINGMHKLGYTDFDIFSNVNPDKVDYYHYLNNDSIKLINKFYYYDFILFNYSFLS
jgi:hypothetical protein